MAKPLPSPESGACPARSQSHQSDAGAAPSHCVDDAPVPHMNPSGHSMTPQYHPASTRTVPINFGCSTAGAVGAMHVLDLFTLDQPGDSTEWFAVDLLGVREHRDPGVGKPIRHEPGIQRRGD